MAQKIKPQDGIVTYTSPDVLLPVEMNINGQMNVRDSVNVGDDILLDGIISTADGSLINSPNLEITTGAYGSLNIHQHSTGGRLTFNNVQWPPGAIIPNPGMFLGITATNTLEYLPFVLGFNPSDTLTLADLNGLYPSALPGQNVIGTNVIYLCISTGDWRIIATTTPSPGI